MSLSTTKTRDWDSTGQAIVKKINKALGSTAWQGESISSFDSTSITTAISQGSLVEGGLYKIPTIYNAGDYLYVRALDASTFEPNGVFYNPVAGAYCNVACTVNSGGISIRSNDPTVSYDATTNYNAGNETLTLDTLIGIGELKITVSSTVVLSTISGGFEGMEITIFAEGGAGDGIDVASSGTILANALYSPCFILDDNITFATLKKRGSNWIIINAIV